MFKLLDFVRHAFEAFLNSTDDSKTVFILLALVPALALLLIITSIVAEANGTATDAYLLAVWDEAESTERVATVLEVSVGLLGALELVEVQLSRPVLLRRLASSFRVELVRKRRQQRLQVVDRRALRNVIDDDRGLEDLCELLVGGADDAALHQADDLGSEDGRDASAFLPEDVRDRRLSALERAHVQVEVLVDVSADEIALGPAEVREALAALVVHDVLQHGLEPLGCLHVLLRVHEDVLRVVLELERLLAFLDLLLGREGGLHPLLPVLLPARGIAVERRAALYGLTDDHHEPVAALAVMAHLGLARNIRTVLPGVALGLATVLTVCALLVAPLATAVLLQFLGARVRAVADLVAEVAARQRHPAHLATARVRRVAELSIVYRLPAAARFGHQLHAGRAVAQVTGQWALVAAAFVDLLTRAIARRL